MKLSTETECKINEPHVHHKCKQEVAKWHLVTNFNPMQVPGYCYILGLVLGFFLGKGFGSE